MTSSRSAPDFGRLAERYDELRPADANWHEVADTLVRLGDLRAQRVLDVGCGTGRFASLLVERHAARVWGVDPSPEMLAVARGRAPRGLGLKLGRAEELPFKDEWFDRAVMWLSAHLVDRPRAFAEVRRVLTPGGLLVVGTFDPTHFDSYWVNELFPSVERIDRERFPTADELDAELHSAGFAEVALHPLHQSASVEREVALRKIDGRWISTLRLLDDDEFESGLARARASCPRRSSTGSRG
jgi:ubiquinone/menaquinone biosynthesis C-methylase UbiE